MMGTTTARPGLRTLAAVTTVTGLMLGLLACGPPPESSAGGGTAHTFLDPSTSPEESMNADDAATALDLQRSFLEDQAPAIAEAMGASRVRYLRQTDCSPDVGRSARGASVRWSTTIGLRVPDLEAAVTTGEDVREYLEAHGWSVRVAESLRPDSPGNTLFNAQHAGAQMTLTAEYDHGGGDSTVWIRGGGECVDTPEGHQMLRSPLDSGFGDGTPPYNGRAERESPDYTERTPHPHPGPASEVRGDGS